MAQSRSRRTKRRTKTPKAKSRRGAKRKMRRTKAKKATRGASHKTSTKRKKSGAKRKRTTAEGMKRAMRMKQKVEEKHAGEERPYGQDEKPNWPTKMPSSVAEPERVPENLREQGDAANIIQNTSNRRAG